MASLRYLAMNGTVAPPSSSSTAALTWRTATPSSPAIRWSTDWFWVTQQLCQRAVPG